MNMIWLLILQLELINIYFLSFYLKELKNLVNYLNLNINFFICRLKLR